jgi:hypothetical protein
MRKGLVMLLLLVGCSTPSAGGADPGLADAAPTTTLTYSDIRETIIEPQCTGTACHNADAFLSFFKYGFLVDAQARGEPCEGKGILVVPFDPGGSLLLAKLGTSPPCGSRMPFSLEPLEPGTLEALREWIAAGAPQ